MANQKIYHYTTCDGLIGILRDKCLWASHYKCLNDAKEFAFAAELIYEDLYPVVFDVVKKEAASLSAEKRECIEMLGLENQAKETTNAMINVLYETTAHLNTQAFILSFYMSNNPKDDDNGLLSLWRGYGSDGGVALEFDSEDIKRLMASEYLDYAHAAWGEGKVEYDPSSPDTSQKYLKYRKIVTSEVINMFKSHVYGESYKTSNPHEAVEAFLGLIALSKDRGFIEENEWRVWVQTYNEAIQGDPEQGKSRKPKKHEYRNRRGLLVPYIKLFDDGNCLPIKRIIIGPHSEKQLRKEMLGSYFRNYGIQIPITVSQIPYIS